MADSEDNNALAAKVRAMYGRRLTPANFRELLRKQSVGEVAAYLKQGPGYAALLKDINESLVHRGELESILRRQVFEEYSRLVLYADLEERPFCEYVVIGMEIDEILTCIRLINAGRAGEYFFSLPAFFTKHASFDLYALAKVKSFTDLVDMLAGTPYRGIVEKFQLGADGKADTVTIEFAFRRYYYEKIFALIQKTCKDESLREIRQAFQMEADLANLLMVYRQKKYFGATGDYIKALLLPYHFRVSTEELDHMLQESDTESVRNDIFATYYGRQFKSYHFDYLEKYCDQIEYDYYRKLLMFSMATPAVITSYMHLKNAELANLVNIIEGIRYSVAPSEIEKLLIQTH